MDLRVDKQPSLSPEPEHQELQPAPEEIHALLPERCKVHYTGDDVRIITWIGLCHNLSLGDFYPGDYFALLQDSPLDSWQQNFMGDTGLRPRPHLVILWGKAAAGKLPQFYAWQMVGPLMVGRIN